MQKTIKNKITISGTGLHTGSYNNLTIKPGLENSGILFRRVDLDNKPYIRAVVDNVHATERRTVIKENGAVIETVEHLLAAIFALNIDNLMIEIDGPEVPIFDGSSQLFINALEKSIIVDQTAKRKRFKIPNYFKVENTDGSKIEFYPQDNLEIEVSINYNSDVIQKQKASLSSLDDFKNNTANARTFCFLHELDYLMKNDLLKGGNLNNGLVFINQDTPIKSLGKLKKLLPKHTKILKKGVLNNEKMRYENEQAKHKLLDLVGDIALVGGELKGKIVAHKPGHKINTLFAKKMKQKIAKNLNSRNRKPLMQLDDIKKILPHREPFLFIDEIQELGDDHVTGVKYVKKDEYYFKGHFPGAPVMPGVLQIEAMAQTGGILALSTVEDPENYLTYFMKIDKVKFKQKVEPDCILIFKLHLLSPIRRGICHMQGRAYVDNQVVTEAELMAKIAKEKI